MRESQIQRLGEIRANRDDNEAREVLNFLNRSAKLSKDYNSDDNGINNSNDDKNGVHVIGVSS